MTDPRPSRASLRADAITASTRTTAQGAAVTLAPGDRLRLRDAGERGTLLLEHASTTVGRVRQWSSGALRLTLAGREYAIEPDGRAHGLTLATAADDEQRARFEDRRFKDDLLHVGDAVLTFEGEDEHLRTAEGTRAASFTTRRTKDGDRVVLVDALAPLAPHGDHDDAPLLAFAAVIVLLRRLPAAAPKRFGLNGGRANEGRDLWVAGALSGHADGSW